MYYVFAFIAAMVVIAVVVVWMTGRGTGFVRRHNQVHEELHSDRTPTAACAGARTERQGQCGPPLITPVRRRS